MIWGTCGDEMQTLMFELQYFTGNPWNFNLISLPIMILLLVSKGSGNGLLPNGGTPLPEPMSSYDKWGKLTGNTQQCNLTISITKLFLIIAHLKSQPHCLRYLVWIFNQPYISKYIYMAYETWFIMRLALVAWQMVKNKYQTYHN